MIEFFKDIFQGIFDFTSEIAKGLAIFILQTLFRLLCILGWLTNVWQFMYYFKTIDSFFVIMFYICGVFIVPFGVVSGWIQLLISMYERSAFSLLFHNLFMT